MKQVTVLSFDPGTKNFAASLVTGTVTKTPKKIGKGRRYIKRGLSLKVHGTCILQNTVTELTGNLGFNLKNFLAEIDKLIESSGVVPDEIIMERFQSRGLGGTTIECVNFMLGSMVLHFQDMLQTRLVTAATWKNRANARFDLKAAYKGYDLHRVITEKTEHELDACLMGIYQLHQTLGFEDYECFAQRGSFESFMDYFLTLPNLHKNCK